MLDNLSGTSCIFNQYYYMYDSKKRNKQHFRFAIAVMDAGYSRLFAYSFFISSVDKVASIYVFLLRILKKVKAKNGVLATKNEIKIIYVQ